MCIISTIIKWRIYMCVYADCIVWKITWTVESKAKCATFFGSHLTVHRWVHSKIDGIQTHTDTNKRTHKEHSTACSIIYMMLDINFYVMFSFVLQHFMFMFMFSLFSLFSFLVAVVVVTHSHWTHIVHFYLLNRCHMTVRCGVIVTRIESFEW